MVRAEQHEVDGTITCARGPSTEHVTGAAGMIVHALSWLYHGQERCTGGGGSRQSSREAARVRSCHAGLASVVAAGGRYSRLPSNPCARVAAVLGHLLGVLHVRGGRVDQSYGASDGAEAEVRRRHRRLRPGDDDVDSTENGSFVFLH